jgi:Flp pilus assembly protein TadG
MSTSVRKPLTRQRQPLLGDRRGNAMIEFAIGSLLLVAVFTGTYEFAYTYLQYNNLENAVTRGAHYAGLAPYDSASSTPSTAFSTAVKNMVVYGTTTAGTSPTLNGLATSNVNFSVSFDNLVPDKMTVSISNFTINSFFWSSTLTNKPVVTYPYQGVWSPN